MTPADPRDIRFVYTRNMTEGQNTVRVHAFSPGEFTILVVALPSGELRTTYRETDYDLHNSKLVTQEWLQDNAIGRHSFVPVDPPEEVEASTLPKYAQKLRGG
jgi:hypothetical protein